MRWNPALFTIGSLAAAAPVVVRRARLSRAKHRSLAGHSKLSRLAARLTPAFDYAPARAFACDGAPADIVASRVAGFERLAALYAERFAKGRALTAATRPKLADLDFTDRYRVPFPFAETVTTRLTAGAFAERASGVTIIDVDGNLFYDLSGSYGVNLLGTDRYKVLIADAVAIAKQLGPVLGPLHPLVADNVARLTALTGLDAVSFHMSGTEAVMQAVRLARYHTGRSHLVRLAGAYHGWWGDVQPGVGNPVPADRTYTLADLSDRTLRVLATRRDIACVLVNPLQALHPNAGAPSDNMLAAGGRRAGVDRDAYSQWLHQLQATCRAAGIVLILDDVFTGFRLARGGGAEYFGIEPDMVTLGKTLGGGLPVGVVVGRDRLMRRYRRDHPADICFARGTFNAHPYVMAAMNGFLRALDEPGTVALYDGLDERWAARAAAMNRALKRAGVPVRVANLSSIWTVLYDAPSRFNWMLQYYLRAEGLWLSWVGTGRLIFSLNYGDADFAEVVRRFVAAACAMAADGWWWTPPGANGGSIARELVRDLARARFGR